MTQQGLLTRCFLRQSWAKILVRFAPAPQPASPQVVTVSFKHMTGQHPFVVGGAAALSRYERQRLAANTAMAAGLHAMQRVMLSDEPLVVAARSLGTQAIANQPAAVVY
jgi:hypothetical protein